MRLPCYVLKVQKIITLTTKNKQSNNIHNKKSANTTKTTRYYLISNNFNFREGTRLI